MSIERGEIRSGVLPVRKEDWGKGVEVRIASIHRRHTLNPRIIPEEKSESYMGIRRLNYQTES